MTSLEMSNATTTNSSDIDSELETAIHQKTSVPVEPTAPRAEELVIWPAVNARGSSMRLVRNPLPTADDKAHS
ncbi:MAG: hypothetical protein R3D67_03650 [Hyphomicrobiaceae bacterium]